MGKRFLCLLLICIILLPSVSSFADVDGSSLTTAEQQESTVFSYFVNKEFTEQGAAAITALRRIKHKFKNESDSVVTTELSPDFISCFLLKPVGGGYVTEELVPYDTTFTTIYDAVCFGYFGFTGGYEGGNGIIVKYSEECKDCARNGHEVKTVLLSYGANPYTAKLCTNLFCQINFFEKNCLKSSSSSEKILEFLNVKYNDEPDKTYKRLKDNCTLDTLLSGDKSCIRSQFDGIGFSSSNINTAKNTAVSAWHVLLSSYTWNTYSTKFLTNQFIPTFRYDSSRKNVADVFVKNIVYKSNDSFFSTENDNIKKLDTLVCNFHDLVSTVYNKYKDGQTGTYIDTDTVAGIVDEMRTTGYWTEDEISSFSRLSEMNIQAMYLDGATKENLTQSELENLEKWKDNIGYGDNEAKIIRFFRQFIQIIGILCLIYAMLLYSAYWIDKINPFFYLGALTLVSSLTFHKIRVAVDECSASLYSEKIENNNKGKVIEEVTHNGIVILCLKWMFVGVLFMTGIFYELMSKLFKFAGNILDAIF